MKSTIKVYRPGLFGLLLLAGVLTFFACQKESLLPKGNNIVPNANKAMVANSIPDAEGFQVLPSPTPFELKIVMSKCKTAKPKVNLEAVIADNTSEEKLGLPPKFKYKWEANGHVVGTKAMLPCFCAKSVKLTATRVADNVTVSKTITLKVCNSNTSAIHGPDIEE